MTAYMHILDLAKEVEPRADVILSKTIYQDDQIKAVVFGFGKGQELSEHTAAKSAVLFFVKGEASIGLGGDSEIGLALNGQLTVGPQRVAPISLLAHRYPEVVAMLEVDVNATEGGSLLGRFVLKPFGTQTGTVVEGLSAREAELMARVTDRPRPLRQIAVHAADQRALAALKRKGLIQTGGFTPSDAAHVLGLQDNWPGPAAELAARLMVRRRDMKVGDAARVQAFCREVWSDTVRRSCSVILETAFAAPVAASPLVDAACAGEGQFGLAKISLSPVVPVVAVGGPVRVFYGEVAKRLNCEVVFPPFCDVANAVGAAAGVVAQTIVITVEGDGSGLFRMHGPAGTVTFKSGAAAVAAAEILARDTAMEAVQSLGASHAQVQVSVEKHLLPEAIDDSGLLEAVVRAEAMGRPDAGH